jgi:hypothetical protein
MMMTNSTVLVTGNTYPVKDSLKAMGARWDAANKGWRVPAAKAAAAQALVSGAVKAPYVKSSSAPARRCTCVGCGGQLDRFQISRGFKFCSKDCVNDMRLGGQSGYVNGVWHQGEDD